MLQLLSGSSVKVVNARKTASLSARGYGVDGEARCVSERWEVYTFTWLLLLSVGKTYCYLLIECTPEDAILEAFEDNADCSICSMLLLLLFIKILNSFILFN